MHSHTQFFWGPLTEKVQDRVRDLLRAEHPYGGEEQDLLHTLFPWSAGDGFKDIEYTFSVHGIRAIPTL